MQKLFCMLFILLSFSAFAATERTNNVCFPGWEKVTFEFSATDPDNFIVTKGQPFSGIVPKSQPKEKYCFAINAGRKNSTAVMTWLNNKYAMIAAAKGLNPGNVPISAAYYYFAGYVIPEQANFGVYGTLTFEKIVDQNKITFTCPEALIAQTGNYHSKVPGNIWFIYPTAKNTDGYGFLSCKDQHQVTRYIYLEANRVDIPGRVAARLPEDDAIEDDNIEMGIYSTAMADNTFRSVLVN